jgi:hypothetical protein
MPSGRRGYRDKGDGTRPHSFQLDAPPVEQQKRSWEGRGAIATTPGKLTKHETFYYNLSLPISTAIIGCDSVEQVEECVELARSFTPFKSGPDGCDGSESRTCCQAGPIFPAHAPPRIRAARQSLPLPRDGARDWGVSLCLFVPTKKPTSLGKCSCGTAGRTDLAVLLFLFVPAKNRPCSSKLLIRFGVPDGI